MFKISELMTSPVYSLREADTLQSARLLMDQKRIRHVPITPGENVFRALITNPDVLKQKNVRFKGKFKGK